MTFHPGALQFSSRVLSDAIRPRALLPFVEWLETNIVLVDGPLKGELWSAKSGPYLRDIAECLSLEDPCREVTVRKCQQSGVSILALAWSLYLADRAPDNILYGVPGIDALKDINAQKFQPMIDAWENQTGKSIITPTTDRSGRGSTVYEKRFPGGYISLANANVVMDLSSKTARYGIKDEVSKWQELPNGADPETLFWGRFTAFRRTGNFKIFGLSTPEIDTGDESGDAPGHCRIDRDFKRSDQRYFYIECPQCNKEFVQAASNFHPNRKSPHLSCIVCPECTYPIDDIERAILLPEGRCKPTLEGPDRHPGFHIDAFCSSMMSLEAIAEDYFKAENKGEIGQKDYHNLVLALPFQMRGNAPDYEKLLERSNKNNRDRAQIPADGLLFVAGADVQHDGIYVEAVAFGSDRQSWSVEIAFLDGPTDDKNAGAWLKLRSFLIQEFKDDFGGVRYLEALAVDSGDGNRVSQVLEWCRENPKTYAIKGAPGRGHPPIAGVPQNKSISKRGKRKRVGKALQWSIGTWVLKAEFYGNLHKGGLLDGEQTDPPGYCHFCSWHGEEFFKQITAEYFHSNLINGRLIEEWKTVRTDNHFLDCRVYAMAMAELYGLSTKSQDDWAAIRKNLCDSLDGDLFTAPSTQASPAPRPEAAHSNTRSKWLKR